MFPNIGMGELVLILLIVLLLFGAKRLPEIAKGMGKSIRSFKDGLSDAADIEPQSPDDKTKKDA